MEKEIKIKCLEEAIELYKKAKIYSRYSIIINDNITFGLCEVIREILIKNENITRTDFYEQIEYINEKFKLLKYKKLFKLKYQNIIKDSKYWMDRNIENIDIRIEILEKMKEDLINKQ